MTPYVTLGVTDTAAARAFYDAALACIGWSAHGEFAEWRAYSPGGSGTGFILWVCTPYDGNPATPGNGTMLGLPARSRAEVDAFHATALANGGRDEGAPGIRAIYGPNWYAAYVRDPSGNKLGIYYNA